MKYNFDKVIDRSGTSAEKVEGLKHIWGRTDLIPLWVADMDFQTAPAILERLEETVKHGCGQGNDKFCSRHCTRYRYGYELFYSERG